MEILNDFLNKKLTPFQLEKEILRSDLSSFIHKTFNTINPGVLYNDNWHIDLIAEYLKSIFDGSTKKINN